jgi:hypothetical protein
VLLLPSTTCWHLRRRYDVCIVKCDVLKVELDAVPHVLIVVRSTDDAPPIELPTELAGAAVEVTEEQVGFIRRIQALPHCVNSPKPSIKRSATHKQ